MKQDDLAELDRIHRLIGEHKFEDALDAAFQRLRTVASEGDKSAMSAFSFAICHSLHAHSDYHWTVPDTELCGMCMEKVDKSKRVFFKSRNLCVDCIEQAYRFVKSLPGE